MLSLPRTRHTADASCGLEPAEVEARGTKPRAEGEGLVVMTAIPATHFQQTLGEPHCRHLAQSSGMMVKGQVSAGTCV